MKLNQILIENNDTMILYHGTSLKSAMELSKNGWRPRSGYMSGNSGNQRYLYVTTEFDNALWFAQEQGNDSVVSIKASIRDLIVDPEDGIGHNVRDELNISKRSGVPAYLAIKNSIPSYKIKIVRK